MVILIEQVIKDVLLLLVEKRQDINNDVGVGNDINITIEKRSNVSKTLKIE